MKNVVMLELSDIKLMESGKHLVGNDKVLIGVMSPTKRKYNKQKVKTNNSKSHSVKKFKVHTGKNKYQREYSEKCQVCKNSFTPQGIKAHLESHKKEAANA